MLERTHSFGYWLRRRRKALDLTQEALGQRVSCSSFTIRKIESDERRPSRPLAERLAQALAISDEERSAFLQVARASRAVNQLQIDAAPLADEDETVTAISAVVPVETSPFVGRANEYGLLTGMIARLTTGMGGNVLIEGEPGIGKSRLLYEVAQYARTHNIPTLTSNCYEIERAMPYQPVIDLMTRALRSIADTELRALAPVSLAELAALVPEIGERVTDLPQLSNDFPEARQARLSRALDQLLEAWRGGRPALMMVDDIQWADDASAQVLHYLARNTSQRPLLIIYCYRDEAIDSDEHFARLIASLRRDTDARHMTLSRLGYTDTEQIISALGHAGFNTADLALRLHRETEGNPFFLMSILHALSDGETQLQLRAPDTPGLLPDALRAAVRTRLNYVPKEIRPVLETAAVLGRRFDFDMLLDVTRETEVKLLDAVEALVKRRLLREEAEGGVYDFCHDKLREVVYRDMSGTRRKLLHRCVAETLERVDESNTHEHAAQLAEHYERAHSWSKALKYLLLAAEHSQTLFAMRDALHWLDRALALAEAHPQDISAQQQLAIIEQRGLARAQAGQTQGAVSDMRHVIELLRAQGNREKTRDALIQLGMAYRRADQYDAATACLNEALAESRCLCDERHIADTLYHLGTVAWSTGQNTQAIEFHQQAVEICERTGFTDLVAVQAYHGRGEAYFANAEPAAAINCYTRSLELARNIGDRSYESENLMMIGHACVGNKGLGDYSRAMKNFAAALDIARSADLQWHFGPTLIGMDHVRACTGHYGEAWNGMQKTLHWLQSLNQVRYQFIAYDGIGNLLLDLDLNTDVIRQLEQGVALGHRTGILFWRAVLDTCIAVARSRLGMRVDIPALEATLIQTRRNSERYLLVRCLDGLAEISFAAGEQKRCRDCAEELLNIAQKNTLPEPEAVARRWRGEILMLEKNYPAAQEELSVAAKLADITGRVRLQYDIHHAQARLCAAQNRRAIAQQHRDHAAAIARKIEMSLVGSGLEAHLH